MYISIKQCGKATYRKMALGGYKKETTKGKIISSTWKQYIRKQMIECECDKREKKKDSYE